MAFHSFLKIPNVVDLVSKTKTEAIDELARILLKAEKIKRQKPIVDEILKNEEAVSSFIGHGIAMPLVDNVAIRKRFSIIVGRIADGIDYDAARGARVHIIVLVFAKDSDVNSQVELKSELTSFFKSEQLREELLKNEPLNLKQFALSIKSHGKEKNISTAKAKERFPILTAAISLSKNIKASAIVLFTDVVRENDFLKALNTKDRVIIVTNSKSRFTEEDKKTYDIIQAPPFPASRTGQIKIGILLAISQDLIDKNDTVVCVSGNSRNGTFDTVVALDIDKEYQFFFSEARSIIPQDVKPEVLERVMGLASEIAVEGREGKPTGTIFVLGDTNQVNIHVRQLIINPFRGYSEVERNILDPGLDETIKEFASIDGAFIITGDGVVLSAGSYLRPPADSDENKEELPSGFGSRHAAARAITACTNALAITISESTGMVSIFKNGSIMLTLAKPVGRSSKGGTRVMSVPI